MKIKYKPKFDCCNHHKTDNFTLGYQANIRTGKPSRFKVYICDNCGEVHDPYSGIKGWLSRWYFVLFSQGCIFIPDDEEVPAWEGKIEDADIEEDRNK